MRAWPFDPDVDRREARLAPSARRLLLADTRRIVIVGAGGWIGRTVIALLHEALGARAFAERVVCFGSRANTLDVDDGLCVQVRPLADLVGLEHTPTLLLHLAFLTKDRVGRMSTDDYVRANRALSQTVLGGLDAIGVDRLFVASSGAAAFADDELAAPDLRLYGGLKRDDEQVFADWARAEPEARRTVIARIYSVSGPWINTQDVYALAGLILDALAERPVEVRAPMRVWRSYVAVREVVSLAVAALLAKNEPTVLRFDTGGAALELGEVGARVAEVFGAEALRRPVTDPTDNRYVGDDAAYAALLRRHDVAHPPLTEQIVETAAYLARCAP